MRRRRLALFLLLFALACAGCSPAHRFVDADQGQLDSWLDPLTTTGEVGQTFVARHDNLAALEVLLVLHGSPTEPAPPQESWICTLRRDSPDGPQVASVQVALGGRRHNDSVLIDLPRQPDSRDQTYYFSIRASSGNRAALWYSSFDAYADGTMFRAGRAGEGDLRFRTYYDYDVPQALREAAAMATRAWPVVLGAGLLLVVPGMALYLLLCRPTEAPDLVEATGWCISLSLAALPLVLLWATALGGRWQPWQAVLLIGLLGATGAIWVGLRRPLRVTVGWPDLIAVLVIGLTTVVRFLQVRELVVPAWVDSVHHTFVTDLIIAQGRVPLNYEPAFPSAGFLHHFGFQAVAAWLAWLARLPAERAVLIYGQILNALAAWTGYILVRRLTGERIAGLAAVLAIGLLSPMPAYYVSWGRYTQLAGMVLLPLAIVATMDALSRNGWRPLLVAGIAAAGLFLTHYRVIVFFAVFVVAYLPFGFCEWRHSKKNPWGFWLRLLAVTGLSLLLASPWLLRLWDLRLGSLMRSPAGWQGAAGQNAMPTELLRFAGMEPLFYLAGLGAIFGLLRRRTAPLLIVLWVAFVYALANLPFGSDRGSWFLTNASLAISVYFPVALLLGELAAALWAWLQRLPAGLARWARLAVAGIALVAGLYGAWHYLPIANPQTILVTADDMAAMQWIGEHTSSDARFLVNAVPWQVGLYRGTDGGWWIPLLTGRPCTLPPVLYKSATPQFRSQVDQIAQAISHGELPGGEEWREHLHSLGVEYIYVGAKGGPLKVEKLRGQAGLRPVYIRGPVWIFRVE